METKQCTGCHQVKELDQFSIAKNCKGGRNTRCRECQNSAQKIRYWENRDEINSSKRSSPERWRNTRLKREYGISQQEYDELFAHQDGKCAICQKEQPKLSVDHCHATLRVRGLLCTNCNIGLGHFKDNVELLEAAILYLGLVTGKADNACKALIPGSTPGRASKQLKVST